MHVNFLKIWKCASVVPTTLVPGSRGDAVLFIIVPVAPNPPKLVQFGALQYFIASKITRTHCLSTPFFLIQKRGEAVGVKMVFRMRGVPTVTLWGGREKRG